jgi:hypothetical protein
MAADSGYRGGILAALPERADFTTRTAANSVFQDLPGPRTGRPGRPPASRAPAWAPPPRPWPVSRTNCSP